MSDDGYSLIVCSCEGGPYLGARKAGTPCCCEGCGFITQDQLDAILATAAKPTPIQTWPQHPTTTTTAPNIGNPMIWTYT